MTTLPPETELVAHPDPEQTRAKAQRLVATYATDAADCARLLDVLGLRGDPLCIECGSELTPRRRAITSRPTGMLCSNCRHPAPAPPPPRAPRAQPPKPEKPALPLCACGRPASIGVKCARCAQYVPKADLRLVIERIKRDTDMSTTAIAKRLGMFGTSLRRSISPTGRSGHVRRSTYTAAVRLAQELSA